MQLLVRNYPSPFPAQFLKLVWGVEPLRGWEGVSGLEILFAVETGSFDEGDSALARTGQQDEISWK
jgi:hypothetical protein